MNMIHEELGSLVETMCPGNYQGRMGLASACANEVRKNLSTAERCARDSGKT